MNYKTDKKNPHQQNAHMLEQIKKFQKYDSEEATESGVECLCPAWGQKMQELMLVLENYIHSQKSLYM